MSGKFKLILNRINNLRPFWNSNFFLSNLLRFIFLLLFFEYFFNSENQPVKQRKLLAFLVLNDF